MKDRLRFAAGLAAALLIIASFVLSGWALMSRFQEGTRTRNAQTEALRTVLCFARASIPSSDPAIRDQADKFYDHALALIHARPCNPIPKGTP